MRTVLAPALLPADWVVAACDVGQGDAVLVRSGGQVALIDVGPEAAPVTNIFFPEKRITDSDKP